MKDELIEYRVTVGVKYGSHPSQRPHPKMPGLTSHHYLAVFARDYDSAVELTTSQLGKNWAFIYPPSDYPAEQYVRGGPFAAFYWSPMVSFRPPTWCECGHPFEAHEGWPIPDDLGACEFDDGCHRAVARDVDSA